MSRSFRRLRFQRPDLTAAFTYRYRVEGVAGETEKTLQKDGGRRRSCFPSRPGEISRAFNINSMWFFPEDVGAVLTGGVGDKLLGFSMG